MTFRPDGLEELGYAQRQGIALRISAILTVGQSRHRTSDGRAAPSSQRVGFSLNTKHSVEFLR